MDDRSSAENETKSSLTHVRSGGHHVTLSKRDVDTAAELVAMAMVGVHLRVQMAILPLISRETTTLVRTTGVLVLLLPLLSLARTLGAPPVPLLKVGRGLLFLLSACLMRDSDLPPCSV